MESRSEHFDAAVAYVPVIGWIYVALSPRKDEFSLFHLRQSVGLIVFLLAVFAGWVIVSWILAWIPYGVVIASTLFTLVVGALLFGVAALIAGVFNAVRGKMNPLPIFGRWAHNKLPW